VAKIIDKINQIDAPNKTNDIKVLNDLNLPREMQLLFHWGELNDPNNLPNQQNKPKKFIPWDALAISLGPNKPKKPERREKPK
jgi:hypothetical protein